MHSGLLLTNSLRRAGIARSARGAAAVAPMWTLGRGFGAGAARNLRVLHSDNRRLPARAVVDENLDAVARSEAGVRAELFNEFLDRGNARPDRHDDPRVEFLRAKHASTHVDDIVAVRGPAPRFLLPGATRCRPGVAVVQVGVGTREPARQRLPRTSWARRPRHHRCVGQELCVEVNIVPATAEIDASHMTTGRGEPIVQHLNAGGIGNFFSQRAMPSDTPVRVEVTHAN